MWIADWSGFRYPLGLRSRKKCSHYYNNNELNLSECQQNKIDIVSKFISDKHSKGIVDRLNNAIGQELKDLIH